MKHHTPERSIVDLVEDMINKNENLLLDYTVDQLIDMAASGKEINIDGCSSECPRFPTEE